MSAGGLILLITSSLSALLLIAALIYSTGIGQRHLAALAAADCEPNLSPSGQQCTTVQMLTSQYMAILTPTSQQLSTDASAYTANERHHLAAAKAALAERGLTRILCECGPTLFGDLARSGVVDELCLSITPMLAGPGARRIVAGPMWDAGPRSLELTGLLEENGALFCRYRVAAPS